MKKRVLIVSSTFPRWNNDKIPRFVFEFAKNLSTTHTVDVLAPHFSGAQPFEDLEGLKVYRFIYAPFFLERLAYGGGITENLREKPWLFLLIPFYCISLFLYLFFLSIFRGYDLVNVHWMIPSGIIALPLKFLFRFKLVVTVHGGDVYGFSKSAIAKLIPLRFFTKLILKYSDAIIVVSSKIKEVLQRYMEVGLEKRIFQVPMGVNIEAFKAKDFDSTNFDAPRILFVGRLAEKKGVLYLLKAISLLKEKGFPCATTIVGDGVEHSRLEVLAHKLNVEEIVSFSGFVSVNDLPEVYRNHDIFVGPSIEASSGDTEGLPVSFIEAMSSGLPVIVSDTGGIRDLVEDNVDGVIVPPQNEEAIAEAIKNLCANPEFARKLSKGASQKAKNYSWDVVMEKFRNVLEALN